MINNEVAAPPLEMRFIKELKIRPREWKVGEIVEAWPAQHIKKCYNVRLKSNPDIALLAVPEHHLELVKKP